MAQEHESPAEILSLWNAEKNFIDKLLKICAKSYETVLPFNLHFAAISFSVRRLQVYPT